MKQFEYKKVDGMVDAIKPQLDALGVEGWEVVSLGEGGAFLKREKPLEQVPTPEAVEAPPPKVCGTCTKFTRVGALNKRTGLVPGHCRANDWSTNQMDTCEKYEAKTLVGAK